MTRSTLLSAGLVAARVIVGGIFVLAGVGKVGNPGEFADSVRAFHILPPDLVLAYALIVPWLEILAGVYLIVGFMSKLAAALVIFLLLNFIVAIADALVTGNTAHPCGCFGSNPNVVVAWLSGGNTVTTWDLIRDILLVLLAAAILLRGTGAFGIDSLLARRRGQTA